MKWWALWIPIYSFFKPRPSPTLKLRFDNVYRGMRVGLTGQLCLNGATEHLINARFLTRNSKLLLEKSQTLSKNRRSFQLTMSRGAVSIIFSKECTKEERDETIKVFKQLDHTKITQDNEIKGYGYRINEFNGVLHGRTQPKQIRSVTTQTNTDPAVGRSTSPSIFETVTNQNQLYFWNIILQ